jgi:DNA-binding response OmpR family regulator
MCSSPNIASATPSATTASRAKEARARSVLIADDHEDTRLMLRTILEMNGFYVLEATDGETTVQLTKKERPDMVLMDFSLPIFDGLTALQLIRANETTAEVPIIFLSGWAGPAAQIAAREAGCNDYLVKPVNLEQLLQLIERRLNSKAEVIEVS